MKNKDFAGSTLFLIINEATRAQQLVQHFTTMEATSAVDLNLKLVVTRFIGSN